MGAEEIFTRHLQVNHRPKHSAKIVAESFAVGFEPTSLANSELGNLYLLFENLPDDYRMNINKFLDGCGKAFYESGVQVSFHGRFKICLRALNELISKSKSRCNIGLVAVQADKMLFASVGEPTMIHLRKDKATSLAEESPGTLFKEIGSGTVQTGDIILLASKAVSTSFTLPELGKIIAYQAIEDSKNEIVKSLKLPTNIPYSMVIVQAEKLPIPKDLLRRTPENLPKKSKTKISHILESLQATSQKGGKKIKEGLKKSASQTKTKVLPSILSKSKSGWTKFWSKYINPKPKQAFIVVIISIIIIGGFIWWSPLFSSQTPALRQLDDAITLITAAEASLEKNNQQAVQENINRAKQILTGISKTDQEKLNLLALNKKIKQGYSDAQSSLSKLEDKITSTTRIKLANGFDITQASLRDILWANNSLYGLDASAGAIIEINPLMGAPASRATNADLINAKAIANLGDTGLVALGSSSLWQYTVPSGLQQLAAPSDGAIDIATYFNNLYLLSPSEAQVIRYVKAGLTLTSKARLLKNQSAGSLSGASSFVVSGNIFITEGKKIKVFDQGSEQSYDINNLPDSFGDIKDSYLNTELGYFVLLNKDSNRLALLNTSSDSANFVRLYALENNAPIYAFTIEPSSSQLFINTDNKIITYKIEK